MDKLKDKPYWNYYIISMSICCICTIGYIILWFLVLLLNLTSRILNMIVTILMITMLISFIIVIGIIIVFIRDMDIKE